MPPGFLTVYLQRLLNFWGGSPKRWDGTIGRNLTRPFNFFILPFDFVDLSLAYRLYELYRVSFGLQCALNNFLHLRCRSRFDSLEFGSGAGRIELLRLLLLFCFRGAQIRLMSKDCFWKSVERFDTLFMQLITWWGACRTAWVGLLFLEFNVTELHCLRWSDLFAEVSHQDSESVYWLI